MNSSSNLDSFSTLVANLLFSSPRRHSVEPEPDEQHIYRRNIFRTMRDYTQVMGAYHRNIESLISLLQFPLQTPETRSFYDTAPLPTPATPAPAETYTGEGPDANTDGAARVGLTGTLREEPSPNTSLNHVYELHQLNNITRVWGRPRTTPRGIEEYMYLFTQPGLTRQYNSGASTGLTPEEILHETAETAYDSSDHRMAAQCPISFDEFREGENILQIRRCGHIFKPDELRRWLTRHTGCPVCRRELRDTAFPTDEDVNGDEDFPTSLPVSIGDS